MTKELIKECIRLRIKIINQCKEIGSYDANCENMMKMVVDNIDIPENSDEAIKNMSEEELRALLERFNEILLKTEKVIDNMNIAIEKTRPKKVDEKKRHQELMWQAIFNRLYYFRYRILNFFGIEITKK